MLIDLITGKSSPLYTRLLEEGLINDQFEVEYFGGPDYGIWLFGGESSDPKRVKELIVNEINRLQAEGLDPDAVEAVRRGCYGRLVAGLDDPSDCAELILSHLVDGVEPLSELNALAEITVEDMNEQLKTRFDVSACTLSVVNPL
jgi:predicted Zn-dependent peptidase